MKLKEILDNQKAASVAKLPAEMSALFAEGIREVDATGITEKALQVGDTAPDFTLTNATGESISLHDELKKGPVVLTWYRGSWCPYCNLTLHELQKYLPQFKEKNATLLALTPDTPDKSLTTKQKHELQFEVLSDLNNDVARTYGLVFALSDGIAKLSTMLEYNDKGTKELPLSATYIVDREGKITFAFLTADYTTRAEPDAILAALDKL